MPMQNQILAIEASVKNKVDEKIKAVYHTFQKPELFNGHVKTYTPKDENTDSQFSEKLPDDRKNIQQSVEVLLKTVREQQTELFDVCFAKDVTNCLAKADVAVDGKVVLKDVPVTYLLWLGHQLDDLHSEIKKMPTLDPAEKWTYEAEQACYTTKPTEQARTKKISMPLVLHPGTKEHPPQVKEITEDVRAGTWKTTKLSAEMPAQRRDELLSRVEKLQHAVKQAREAANNINVPKDLPSAGKAIYDFILA